MGVPLSAIAAMMGGATPTEAPTLRLLSETGSRGSGGGVTRRWRITAPANAGAVGVLLQPYGIAPGVFAPAPPTDGTAGVITGPGGHIDRSILGGNYATHVILRAYSIGPGGALGPSVTSESW